MTPRLPATLLAVALVGSACAGGSGSSDDDAAAAEEVAEGAVAATGDMRGDGTTSTSDSTSTTIEDYPDAQTRALAVRARQARPVDNSALPPRHLEPERHPDTLVDRFAIVSGGPPPDGIQSIDDPTHLPIDAVDWLADDEPVAVLTVGGETRIYPAQILVWHEIVNDVVAGVPVAMTYCPLCNSVVAFESTIDGDGGTVLEFGTSGALYQSALVMYDRQTESLWTHFDGVAVVGDLLGTELTILPAAMVSWRDARAANPDALVLDRPTGLVGRPYGEAPYPNYETAPPSAGHVTGEIDDRLDPKQRVVGINLAGERVAIDRRALADDGVVELDVGGQPVVVRWEPGTTSALDGEAIADGLAVGAVGVFLGELDGERLTFEPGGDGRGTVVDSTTGSTWDVLGRAIDGPLAGRRLDPLPHLDTFWFAWSRYHPDTDVVG
ncbi:MAG: DUF3179 domain-containing protein [Actinomycetota bacterium]